MERFKSKKSGHYLQYCVFDIVYFGGEKVANLPLIERKELLMGLELDQKHIVNVQWIVGNGIPYFNLVKEKGLEGIVLKKKILSIKSLNVPIIG
jgi:DNA ligase 1